MRLARTMMGGAPHWIVVEGRTAWKMEGSPFANPVKGARVGPVKNEALLPPCEPSKVVALAHNYRSLVGKSAADEEPLVFLKSPTSVVGPNDPIAIPRWVDRTWVEVELAFVVSRRCRNVAAQDAEDHILGFTVANDVTAANVHGRDHHLARSKALDSFCPVGPWLDTEFQPSGSSLSTRVNGKATQDGSTDDRIMGDAEALELVSRMMTLEPGDLVLTGTPAGAMDSVVKPGDEARLEVDGLGRLANPVQEAG